METAIHTLHCDANGFKIAHISDNQIRATRRVVAFSGGEVIKYAYRVPGFDEGIRKVRTNKSAPASHQIRRQPLLLFTDDERVPFDPSNDDVRPTGNRDWSRRHDR